MARRLAYGGTMRLPARGVSSFACLAFVALLGTAFWAGAVWLAQLILTVSGLGR